MIERDKFCSRSSQFCAAGQNVLSRWNSPETKTTPAFYTFTRQPLLTYCNRERERERERGIPGTCNPSPHPSSCWDAEAVCHAFCRLSPPNANTHTFDITVINNILTCCRHIKFLHAVLHFNVQGTATHTH